MFSFLRTAVLRNYHNRSWLIARNLSSDFHQFSLSSSPSSIQKPVVEHQRLKQSNPIISEDSRRKVRALLPELISTLTEDDRSNQTSELNAHFAKLMEYYFLQEDNDYVMQIAVVTYEMLEDPEKITPENLRLAMIFAYILETWLQSGVIIDDMADGCETRLAVSCWHKLQGVGINGVWDSVMLEHFAWKLLKKYFSQISWYPYIHYMCHKITLDLTLGVTVDALWTRQRGLSLSEFTMDKVDLLSSLKGGGVLYAPLMFALKMTNQYTETLDKQIETIEARAVHYIQNKDDFDDYYDDIQSGRCSWLVAKALELANPRQKEILAKNFPARTPEAINAVTDLFFKELKLKEAFQESQSARLNDIQMDVLKLDNEKIQNLFLTLWKVYNI